MRTNMDILLDMFDILGDGLWKALELCWYIVKIGLFLALVPMILLWLWGHRALAGSTYEDYLGDLITGNKHKSVR